MKIYDVSQELLSCEIYPGDPSPALTSISSMEKGDLYNLSTLSMCLHNGTHVDAPSHFIQGGKTVSEMDLTRTVGKAYVIELSGDIDASLAAVALSKAQKVDAEAAKRLLIKGNATLTADGARVFADYGVMLVGSETQSVGPLDAPMEVHKILLEKEIVLLEGLRLGELSEGSYFLFGAPINVGIAEGSPCRAVIVDFES